MRNIEKLQKQIACIKERMRVQEIANDSYYLSRDRDIAERGIFELEFEIMFKERFPAVLTSESIPVLKELRWFSEVRRHTLKVKMCDKALAKVGA